MTKVNTKKEFNCDIKTIWNIVTNNKSYQWRSDLSKIEIIDNENFIEYTKNNYPTNFKITKKEEFKEYELEIINSNIKGRWIGLFKKISNDSTELDFTEEITTNNFIMKLLAKPYLKSMQKRYFKDLEKEISKRY